MKIEEFGQLVKTLRHNTQDPLGNFWTRETLSKAIHLTPHQLGRLERGDRKYIDNQTLRLLVQAFKLSKLEQREFFIAASGLTNKELYAHAQAETSLNEVVAVIENIKVPALALDVYSDILAANDSMLQLFMITPAVVDYARMIPAGFNMIHYLYSPHFGCREIFGDSWREIATIEILQFRRSSLRYRHTDYFKALFRILQTEKLFAIDWYSSHRDSDHYNLNHEFFTYEHPVHGPLRYFATETIINTSEGELYLLLYNPADQSTADRFYSFTEKQQNGLCRLAEWPHKAII